MITCAKCGGRVGVTGPCRQCTAPLAVSVKTYHHNIPTSDNPEDHSEGNCPCDPIVDEDAGTVTHQPMPALNAASGPDAGTPDAELDRLLDVFGYGRCGSRAAIHAHVEKVKREARAAGERAALLREKVLLTLEKGERT